MLKAPKNELFCKIDDFSIESLRWWPAVYWRAKWPMWRIEAGAGKAAHNNTHKKQQRALLQWQI